MAPPVKSAAFQPIRRLKGLEKLPEVERALLEQLNAIRLDLARLQARPAFTELKTTDYLAREEETVRCAPGTGGATLLLPGPRQENRGSRITVLIESTSLGDLTIACVGGLVNGANSQTVTLASRVDFLSDGLEGWRSEAFAGGIPLDALASQASDTMVANVTGSSAPPTAVGLSTLAGAGLAFASHTLAVNGSTSIAVTSDQVQRAALTGEATASANANAVTVTRSTNFSSSPWTGDHKFSAGLYLGTEHLENVTGGTVDITIASNVTRLRIQSTASTALNDIIACSDGRILVVEHNRTSGAGDLTINHSTGVDNVACPGDVNLVLGQRGFCVLMGRSTTWRVIAHTN